MTQRVLFARLPEALHASLLLTALMLGCGSDADDEKDGTGSNQATGKADASSAGASSESDDSGSGATGGTGSSDSDAGRATSTAGGASDAGRDSSVVGRDAGAVRDASSNVSDSGSMSDGSSGSVSDGSVVDPSGLARFSFFVTSQAAIVDLAQNAKGFGGNLSYGETGAGAGLRGADKICAEIAERSMEGASAKQWRAFLSASSGGASAGALHARDRIGQGPWYDRKGRLVGNGLADLLSGDRPANAESTIRDDLPNELGVPNRAPDGTQLDNHDTLTGSDTGGRYVSGSNTCEDWTSSSTSTTGGGGGGGSGPAIGHSWPRSATNGRNWVSDHRAGGCGQGINTSNGSSDGTPTVGSGGGYGGFYCFALTP